MAKEVITSTTFGTDVLDFLSNSMVQFIVSDISEKSDAAFGHFNRIQAGAMNENLLPKATII